MSLVRSALGGLFFVCFLFYSCPSFAMGQSYESKEESEPVNKLKQINRQKESDELLNKINAREKEEEMRRIERSSQEDKLIERQSGS